MPVREERLEGEAAQREQDRCDDERGTRERGSDPPASIGGVGPDRRFGGARLRRRASV
jgi:hypothetical protein